MYSTTRCLRSIYKFSRGTNRIIIGVIEYGEKHDEKKMFWALKLYKYTKLQLMPDCISKVRFHGFLPTRESRLRVLWRFICLTVCKFSAEVKNGVLFIVV